MTVENVECHLAIAQLKRYTHGTDMPEEVMAELEKHLKACPDCMAFAQELQQSFKPQAVVEQIEEATPDEASPAKPKVNPLAMIKGAFKALERLRKAPIENLNPEHRVRLLNEPGTPFYPEQKINIRLLLTSGALALTLIAMSTIMRDPTRLFGQRASASKPSVNADKPEQKTETKNNHGEPAKPPQDGHAAEKETFHDTEKPVAEPGHPESAPKADPNHPASGNNKPVQPNQTPRTTGNGLSLPGRPTMDGAPILRADTGRAQPQPVTPSHNRTTNQSNHRGAATPAPRRSNTSSGSQRPPAQPSSSNRPPVKVYLPNGQPKNS